MYGPVKWGTTQLAALDGTTVLQEKSEILGRFAEHFDKLLNIPGVLDVGAASAIHVRPKVHCLSEPPDLKEVVDTIDATREGKAPGKCKIPAEIWKYGGTEIVSKLHQLILSVWSKENAPQDRKDASIKLEITEVYPCFLVSG